LRREEEGGGGGRKEKTASGISNGNESSGRSADKFWEQRIDERFPRQASSPPTMFKQPQPVPQDILLIQNLIAETSLEPRRQPPTKVPKSSDSDSDSDSISSSSDSDSESGSSSSSGNKLDSDDEVEDLLTKPDIDNVDNEKKYVLEILG
jgi:hypothetical protein